MNKKPEEKLIRWGETSGGVKGDVVVSISTGQFKQRRAPKTQGTGNGLPVGRELGGGECVPGDVDKMYEVRPPCC